MEGTSGKATSGDGAIPREVGDLIVREDELNYENFDKPLNEQVRFSKKDREQVQTEITAQYKQRVQKILNEESRPGISVLVGYTPELYRKLGMPDLPLVISSGHIYSMAKTKTEASADENVHKGVNYHGLGADIVENILDYVKNPVMVISSKDVSPSASPLRSTHSVVALIDVGKGDRSMVIPVAITAERTVDGERIDVNAISSAYEKNTTSLVNEAIAQFNTGENSIFYIKKEADKLIGAGVQFPARLKQIAASDGIVCKLGSKINMSVQNVTQSQQFKRWFGDWQNHPASASKVVNKDGTPKVVYHYTNSDFTAFDTGRSGSNQGMRLGDGIYLSSSETEFAGYGKNKMVLYANIRNPFEMQLTKKQAGHVLDKYGSTKHDLEAHDGLYRNHAMSKLTNPIRVMDYLREYAKDNGIRISDILTDLGYDGVHDGAEWVAFSEFQVKSATDNIGTFSKSNPDIRFSRKDDVSVTAKDVQKLQKENDKLTQALDLVRQELKITQGHHVKPAVIDRLAGRILKDYQSTMPKAELVESITQLFDYIGNGERVIWDEVQAGAMNIALNVLDKSTQRNTEWYDATKPARDYLKDTAIKLNDKQLEEVGYAFGSYNDFRRALFGKATVSRVDGIPLEQAWRDLSGMFPDVFDPDTADVDMPVMLYNEVLGMYDRPIENPYGYDLRGYASDLAMQLYDAYMSAPEVNTFADKQQKKLDLTKAH